MKTRWPAELYCPAADSHLCLLEVHTVETKQVESLSGNKAIQYLFQFLALVYIKKNNKLKGVMLSLGKGMKDCSSTGNKVQTVTSNVLHFLLWA